MSLLICICMCSFFSFFYIVVNLLLSPFICERGLCPARAAREHIHNIGVSIFSNSYNDFVIVNRNLVLFYYFDKLK